MNGRVPINFRAFLISAVAVTLAVFCAYAYMLNDKLGIGLGVVYLCALFCAVCVAVYKFIRKKIKLRVVIAACCSAVFSLTAYCIAVAYVNERAEVDSGVYTVTGRVCSFFSRSGEYAVDLEDVTLSGKSRDGMLRLRFAASDENVAEVLRCGDRLEFTAYVYAVPIEEGGKVNGASYRTDIRYSARADGEKIDIAQGKATPYERFILAFHRLFTDNMGEKYGNIAFSLITGDKTALSYSVSEEYSLAGFGHILAVSGLHIGFMTLVLNFVLRAVPIRIRYPIIGGLLIAYAGIAGFSPSVTRAVIMAFVSGASILIFARRDLLSSLMCAYTLILGFKPLYLFEAGFLMSFGSIFGIAMFAGMIQRALARIRVGKKLGGAVAASVSVTVGVLPAQAYFFGLFNILAWIANVILLLYISVVYIATVVIAPFAAIPHLGVLLTACKYLYIPLDYVISQLASAPFAVFSIASTSAVFACFPVMFCAGDAFMMKKGKSAVIIYSALVCVLIFLIAAV